jgi:hypothetical protein
VYELTRTENQVSTVLAHADKTLSGIDQVVSQTGSTVSQLGTTVSGIQSSISSVATELNQTLSLVNHPCVPGPCGTVADIGKTLNTFRGTAGEIEIAAHHEDNNLSTLDSQETKVFQDTDSALLQFSSVETGLTKTNADLDALITDPNIAATTKNLGTITYNLGQTTGDFQNKFHTFLYPPPCHGLKCNLGKIYTIVKVGSQFAEPAYWADQLVRGALP